MTCHPGTQLPLSPLNPVSTANGVSVSIQIPQTCTWSAVCADSRVSSDTQITMLPVRSSLQLGGDEWSLGIPSGKGDQTLCTSRTLAVRASRVLSSESGGGPRPRVLTGAAMLGRKHRRRSWHSLSLFFFWSWRHGDVSGFESHAVFSKPFIMPL